MMGTTTEVAEQLYYIECIGESSTRIGRHLISPNLPPTPYTEEEYRAAKRQIDHYVNEGVIMVSEPGSRAAVLKADAIKREEARIEEIYAGEETDEPDPELRKRGFSISEAHAEKKLGSRKRSSIPKFSAPTDHTDAQEPEYKCIAMTSSGRICNNDANADILVCGTHLSMLEKGKILKDGSGRTFSEDGKSVHA